MVLDSLEQVLGASPCQKQSKPSTSKTMFALHCSSEHPKRETSIDAESVRLIDDLVETYVEYVSLQMLGQMYVQLVFAHILFAAEVQVGLGLVDLPVDALNEIVDMILLHYTIQRQKHVGDFPVKETPQLVKPVKVTHPQRTACPTIPPTKPRVAAKAAMSQGDVAGRFKAFTISWSCAVLPRVTTSRPKVRENKGLPPTGTRTRLPA
jgi:hypothetical protein